MNNKNFDRGRRRFLAASALFALSNISPRLFAASPTYQGPLWLFINADGGWDVTSLCDPKGYDGSLSANNPQRVNNYDRAKIRQAGNILYAPPPDLFQQGSGLFNPDIYTAQQFFTKHYQKLLVINAVDSSTNSHADGQLYNFSGRLREATPCLAALIAAATSPESSLAFMTSGGYSESADLLTPVRMSNSALNAMFEIAYPNRSYNPKLPDSRLYLPEQVENLIQQVSQDRHQVMLNKQLLPGFRGALQNLIENRSNTMSLQSFVDNLLTSPARTLASFNDRKKAHTLYLQGRLALASYQQGLTVSANIVMSGFDSHAKHDETHYPLLMDFLQGIDAILDDAAERGLSDKIVVVVTSDFGRTPFYNQQQGKDHWPIGSVILMGNSLQKIPGNKVLGASTANHQAIKLDPNTLYPDYNNTNPRAATITPANIHQSLRRLAGIENHPLSLLYPLEGAEINLFS